MCVKICANNYILSAASESFSSEDSIYPYVNTSTEKPRSKVWRSTGSFDVTSNNSDIIFNEGGIDFKASIISGNYSPANLATAIKSAFELVGSGIYTVTYNSNKKFTIATSLATLNIKWNDALTTAEDLIGFTGLDTGYTSYIADFLRIHSSEWLKWDFGVETNPNVFSLIGPANAPLKFSKSASIKLQGNETDFWETTPSYEQSLTIDDECLVLENKDGIHTHGLRYWRLVIVDQSSIGYIEAATVYLGESFEFVNGNAVFPLGYNLLDRTVSVSSESGHIFSNLKPQTTSFVLNFQFATKSEIEEFRTIFNNIGVGVPFFIIIDENGYFSTSINRYTKFVRMESAPSINLPRANMFEFSINVLEEI